MRLNKSKEYILIIEMNKVKKKKIVFDSNFDSGNCYRVERPCPNNAYFI